MIKLQKFDSSKRFKPIDANWMANHWSLLMWVYLALAGLCYTQRIVKVRGFLVYRFFHQAVCSPVSKEIYVYGGVVKNSMGAYEATNEFWKFSIGPRMWTNLNVSSKVYHNNYFFSVNLWKSSMLVIIWILNYI